MGHHFTRSTVEAQEWCNRCNKNTMHRVDDRRLGPCLACMARNVASIAENPEPKPEQGGLFEPVQTIAKAPRE